MYGGTLLKAHARKGIENQIEVHREVLQMLDQVEIGDFVEVSDNLDEPWCGPARLEGFNEVPFPFVTSNGSWRYVRKPAYAPEQVSLRDWLGGERPVGRFVVVLVSYDSGNKEVAFAEAILPAQWEGTAPRGQNVTGWCPLCVTVAEEEEETEDEANADTPTREGGDAD